MGARQYVAALGRFLEIDPVAGGNANDYNYPNDPINSSDINGMWSWDDTFNVAFLVLTVIDFIPGIDIGSAAIQGVMLSARAISIASKAARVTEALRTDTMAVSSITRAAARGSGNFGVGSANARQAARAGEEWVGPGARDTSLKGGRMSKDGLRQYRAPAQKGKLGYRQANFESRSAPHGRWQTNGHLRIR